MAISNIRGEWTITALYSAMIDDLRHCHTDEERLLCKITCEREIRDLARRKKHITPGEQSVLDYIGFE